MTGREAAEAIFGADAVRAALDEENPEPVTSNLAAEVHRRANPPGALRAWALSQPWSRFCAVVRIISGVAKKELLDDGE